MTTAVKTMSPSSTYIKLIRKFPLRPLSSRAEYDAAVAVMEQLAMRGEQDLDPGEQDYLDALDEFISLYDRGHFRFVDKRTPLQRLKYILVESGTTQADLKQVLGCSQSLVSMILSGQRELSKDNIKAVAAHFHVDAGLFL